MARWAEGTTLRRILGRIAKQLPAFVTGALLALLGFWIWIQQQGIERSQVWQDKQLALMSELAESAAREIYLREFRIQTSLEQQAIRDSLYGMVDPASLTQAQRSAVRDSLAERYPLEWSKTMEEEASIWKLRSLLSMVQVVFKGDSKTAAAGLSLLLTDDAMLALADTVATGPQSGKSFDTALREAFHEKAYAQTSLLLSTMSREITRAARPSLGNFFGLVPILISVLALALSNASYRSGERRNSIAAAPDRNRIYRTVRRALESTFSRELSAEEWRDFAVASEDAEIWFGQAMAKEIDETWNYVFEAGDLRRLKHMANRGGIQVNAATDKRYQELLNEKEARLARLATTFPDEANVSR